MQEPLRGITRQPGPSRGVVPVGRVEALALEARLDELLPPGAILLKQQQHHKQLKLAKKQKLWQSQQTSQQRSQQCQQQPQQQQQQQQQQGVEPRTEQQPELHDHTTAASASISSPVDDLMVVNGNTSHVSVSSTVVPEAVTPSLLMDFQTLDTMLQEAAKQVRLTCQPD